MERTVIILIDALGHDLAERASFRPKGLSSAAKLKTVFGFSQAALTSIVTGLAPDEHGLWMMYSFSPQTSPFSFLRYLPVSSRRRWLRRLLTWKLSRVDGVRSYYSLYDVPRHVLPYLDLPARRGLFSPAGGGSAGNIFDELARRRTVSRIWDYTTPEEQAFDELEKSMAANEAGFYLLYTASLDDLLHTYGTSDPRIGERLAWYGERIARIGEQGARNADGLRLFVLGDHGMCDVLHHEDIVTPVEKLGLRIPEDYIPFYDSTMARFRTLSERATKSIVEVLAGFPSGRLLGRDEIGNLGIDFPDGRFGDIIFCAEPGTIFLPSYMGTEPVSAMHGYHPATPCMDSVIFSNIDMESGEYSLLDVHRLLLPGHKAGRGADLS
jgi:predicted AlkP superfamily pyrophosphatase or phosphodiesterase